jgi:hypothetical protein
MKNRPAAKQYVDYTQKQSSSRKKIRIYTPLNKEIRKR